MVMEPATLRIAARSRREAMDWSLVLISQGIETTIESPSEGVGWGLSVASPDYRKALEALRQYQIENRRWQWRHDVLMPGVAFDWGCLAWVMLTAAFYWLDVWMRLSSAGLMSSTAVRHGQWWRLFTAIWLHADLAHLAGNATMGFVLLGLAMGRFGTGVGLLAAYLAGAGGNIVTLAVATGTRLSLGASGMVMGALGLLAVQSVSLWRQSPHARKYIVSGICGGVLLFVLLGLAPQADVAAHCGGFAGGLLLGFFLARIPALEQKPKTNLVCGLIFVLLTVLPWWLALRTHGPP